MSTRPSTDHMRKSLKLATTASLIAAGGAAALVANKLVRVGQAALSFCSSQNDEHADRFVGIDVALDLDFCAGEPIHTRTMARALGYELRPISPAKAAGTIDHSSIREFSREGAGLSEAMWAALSDGDISLKERIAMLAEVADVERVVAGIRAALEAGQ